jgi:hypothetical protein
MNNASIIELEIISGNITIEKIKSWLEENENLFKFSINESNCRKWSKWLNDKATFIFPCVCSVREKGCVFIETYYKLNGLERNLKFESYFEQVLSEYEMICQSETTLFDWMRKHKLNWESLVSLDSVIKITLTSEPYKTLDIQIDKDDFKHCFKFKELYEEIYYSNNYQKYINT